MCKTWFQKGTHQDCKFFCQQLPLKVSISNINKLQVLSFSCCLRTHKAFFTFPLPAHSISNMLSGECNITTHKTVSLFRPHTQQKKRSVIRVTRPTLFYSADHTTFFFIYLTNKKKKRKKKFSYAKTVTFAVMLPACAHVPNTRLIAAYS
jgi:hypothetical protein